jgi:hypothetical protein
LNLAIPDPIRSIDIIQEEFLKRFFRQKKGGGMKKKKKALTSTQVATISDRPALFA